MPQINYFHCLRCSRNHFDGELLFDFHTRFESNFSSMDQSDKPPVSHCLWIQNIYDRENADDSKIVTLNLVQANEPGYTPLEKLTMTLKDARVYRDAYHTRMSLTEAHVDAIEASSMFFENGVRYPDNLKHYKR
jgi:hypothetical protein